MSEASQVCPSEKCGHANPPRAHFCAMCGSKLPPPSDGSEVCADPRAECDDAIKCVVADMGKSLGKYQRGRKALKSIKKTAYDDPKEEYDALYNAMGELVKRDSFGDTWTGEMAQDLWRAMCSATVGKIVAWYSRRMAEDGKEKADYQLNTAILELQSLESAEWQQGPIDRAVLHLQRLIGEPSCQPQQASNDVTRTSSPAGADHTVSCKPSTATTSQVDMDEAIVWLRSEEGAELESDVAWDNAKRLASSLTTIQFELLKDVFVWVSEELEESGEEALVTAERLSTSYSPEQFQVLKQAFAWAVAELEEYGDDAMQTAEKLAGLYTAHNLEAFKESFAWAMDAEDGPNLDTGDAFEYALTKSGACRAN